MNRKGKKAWGFRSRDDVPATPKYRKPTPTDIIHIVTFRDYLGHFYIYCDETGIVIAWPDSFECVKELAKVMDIESPDLSLRVVSISETILRKDFFAERLGLRRFIYRNKRFHGIMLGKLVSPALWQRYAEYPNSVSALSVYHSLCV